VAGGQMSGRRGGLSRRAALCAGGVLVAGCVGRFAVEQGGGTAITFGVVADVQYADRDASLGRFYRDSAEKLRECIRAMNQARPAFMVMLGDMIDNAKTVDEELAALRQIDGIYRGFDGPRHYVLGNHELEVLSKEQFIESTGMPGAHDGFDGGGFRFLVLDANYMEDGTPYKAGNFAWTESYVARAEGEWLEKELGRTTKRVIVFVHQPLDDEHGLHGVKNGAEVRGILERSGKVMAVFQGHQHRGAYRKIGGIHYFTMRGMCEGAGPGNSAYAMVRVKEGGGIEVRGYSTQMDYSV